MVHRGRRWKYLVIEASIIVRVPVPVVPVWSLRRSGRSVVVPIFFPGPILVYLSEARSIYFWVVFVVCLNVALLFLFYCICTSHVVGICSSPIWYLSIKMR